MVRKEPEISLIRQTYSQHTLLHQPTHGKLIKNRSIQNPIVLFSLPNHITVCRAMGTLFSRAPMAAISGPPLEPSRFTLVEQRVHIEPHYSPRFEPDDPALVEYLDEHGYVVLKGVASKEEVSRATDLLWSFMEDKIGMMRENPRTWTNEIFQRVGIRSNGILALRGFNQSEFLWFIRTLPKVKLPFQKIFDTDDLICSFDGGNIFRPWHSSIADDHCKTDCGWFHVDQGKLLRGRHAVQGLVALSDVSEETGGFCVIPGSHRLHDELIEYTSPRSEKNFVFVPPSFHALEQKQVLPIIEAGDMILWDSRTIHCNSPSLVYPSSQPTDRLLRLVAYVCMTPSKWATPEVLEKRRIIYERGEGTSHWPHLIPYDVAAEDEDGATTVNQLDKTSPAKRALIVGGTYY